MTAKLNKELSDALNRRDHVEAIDPATGRRVVIMDQSTFQLTQRQSVHSAIQGGISSMESGGGVPLADADEQMRQQLGFPPRQ